MSLPQRDKTFFNFSYNDTISILDGLDLAINFSIITYLSIFFFPEIDLRVSIIFSSLIILLSFAIRLFATKFLKFFKSFLKLNNFNFFLSILPFYVLPILLTSNDFILSSIIILIFCRLFIGICFSIFNPVLINIYQNKKTEDYLFFKHSLLFILGMILGSLIFIFFNEILSNDELNKWGWKIFYLAFSLILIFSYFLNKLFLKNNLNIEINENILSLKIFNFNNFFHFLKNIFYIFPVFFFIIFSSSIWLPKFSNPENMQFLNFNLLNILLIIISSLFLFPLIKLIGKNRSTNFLSFFTMIVSFFLVFLDHKSSYSIDFLKFFISIVSSFCLCIFLLNFKKIKYENRFSCCFFVYNFIFFLILFIVPLLFYYFIHFTISYNDVYVCIALMFVVSQMTRIYKK